MLSSFWTYEPFLFAFGMMVSALRMGVHRSRSPRTSEGHETSVRATLPRRRSGLSDPVLTPSDPLTSVTARSPLPRRRQVPYDPLNPTEPPLTVFSEYRFSELPILASRPRTSPIPSRDNSPHSRSPYTFLTTISTPQTSPHHDT